MTLSESTRKAGRELQAASEATFGDLLRDNLRSTFGWPYKVAAATVYDKETTSEPYGAVIYTPSAPEDTRADSVIPSDNAAAVLEVVQELDLDNFEAAYRRIAVAKGLAKSPAPEVGDTPVSNVTLGAIVAQSARQPLESFAAALERLNAETPHDHWTDMVVVLGTGVISYGVQFPGEGIAGDHLPPARGAGQGNAPPWYVVIAIRPIADFAFNKLVAFLTAQLKFFSPGTQLPKYQDFLVGMPDTCITHGGFQFNLAGHLVPVLREHYNDRYLPPQPLRIEDRKGDLLATIQRLPWQDGAVLLLHGKKVPLEGLLVFFDPPARPTLTTFRRENEVQLSCVLPMSPAQFKNGLRRLQRQSNMLIKPPAGQIVVQKVSDEGTTSPFIARLMLGILRLRDTIYLDAKARDGFDTLFEQVSSSLSSARDAAREIGELWAAHEGKVASGTCVRRTANVIHIDDNIDRDLRRLTETFLNASVRALKHGLQQTAKELGVDLGFWFKKKPAFERGLEALRAPDADLAEYLASARSAWSETLVSRRNAIEHEAWVLPRLSYRDIAGAVVVDEPVVDGMTLRAFTTVMLDRFCCAVEDILAHLIRRRFPAGVGLHEIAVAERAAEAPLRFQITSLIGGAPVWRLTYLASAFDEH